MLSVRVFVRTSLFLFVTSILSAAAALAQQTGTIQGKVTDSSGAVLPGVTVEAKSSVLPTPHTTVSGPDGVYQLPALPPGIYTVTFTLSGFQPASMQGEVQLASVTPLDARLSVQGVSEAVQVTAESGYVDRSSAAITSGLNNSEISKLPVGTQYRDLINLIPGVMYTQDQTRGPSAGASGQDNVYNFDGVNVTLPLFGTLSAEPSAQDIAQFTVVKGGATAVDFNRAGGFNIDSVSKTGTNRLAGQIEYRFQRHNMTADLNNGSASRYDQNRDWFNVAAGGPVLPGKVFFYGSYFRPTQNRRNAANLYGSLPDYDSVRNEGFAKVTFAPSASVLVNASYRDSHRLDTGSQFGAATAATAGSGNEAWQKIGTVDGSWIMKANAFLTFKYTHFENPTRGRPDFVSDAVPNLTPGTHLDTANLDKMGAFSVPKIGTNSTVNAFIQPIINQYGYVDPTTGQKTGGGLVGYGSLFDNDNFFRDAGQVAFNYTLSTASVRHNFHAGYQQYVDSEDLTRSSNGWGSINVPAGTVSFNGSPIFYQAVFQSQGIGTLPKIHSEYRSKSIEANDTVNWKDWTFNVGLIASNDDLYGQGLVNDASTISGFRKPDVTATSSESRRYLMKDIPFTQMFQPRLSTTWAYNHKDTVYVSYARYNPAASSLPRAASWDRNLAATQNADFDANGNLFAVETVASSTGKLFTPGLTPRRYDEWLAGTSRQLTTNLTGRAYFRYRKGTHYWEDTNNNARVAFNPPTGQLAGTSVSVPRTYYIGNLTEQLTQIGTGGSQNSYVIAELDGAFTDYREATFEGEYRKGKLWAQGSMTFSRYYGNFDQDASTTADLNDGNIFVGSSNIGDGAGRQLWDMKLGRLRGDRPIAMKLFGTYQLDWHASLGAFFVAQSGQPWETHSYLPYASLTTSTSNTDRYSEPAGSHRSDMHTQVDLNYTQDLPFMQRYRAGVVFYVYNVFNKQTGYDIQPNFNAANYGQPIRFYDPVRLEMTFRLVF
jgi:Carboxypeptidase regulatory-like domain